MRVLNLPLQLTMPCLDLVCCTRSFCSKMIPNQSVSFYPLLCYVICKGLGIQTFKEIQNSNDINRIQREAGGTIRPRAKKYLNILPSSCHPERKIPEILYFLECPNDGEYIWMRVLNLPLQLTMPCLDVVCCTGFFCSKMIPN
jgi:hypothetical protein